MTLGNRIGQYRRKLGLTQEALAKQLEVTNQAVSKWESDQCCPDISLLPKIADIFGITMDELFGRVVPEETQPRAETAVPEESEATEAIPEEPETPPHREKAHSSFSNWTDSLFGSLFGRTIDDFDHRRGNGREQKLPEDISLDWDDDQTLRVALFIGRKLISGHPARGRIEFCYDGPALNIYSECDVTCGAVSGNVWAGDDVSCDNVGGSVSAGGDVSCDKVDGGIRAEGDVSCENVSGDVHAGGDVNCEAVGGSVKAGGDVSCEAVCSSVSAGGDVDCEAVHGDLRAGGDVSCDEVMGNVTAGGDVSCGDIQGNVQAEGDVSCDSLEGSITAGGSVSIG